MRKAALKRTRLIPRLVACALACLVVASAAARSTGGNEQAAAQDAGALLAAAQVPPDATAVDGEPAGDHGTLASPPVFVATSFAVTKTEFFHGAGSPADVFAWLREHVPAGMTRLGIGSGETVQGGSVDYVIFQRPRVAHKLGTRWLVMSVAPLDDGTSAIRADGYVVWLRPRPAGLTIRGARDLVINAGKKKIHVGDGATVHRIARMFNALDLVQPGTQVCPSVGSVAHPRLSFRSRAGGKVIAYAHVRPDGCPRADMVVGGHRYDPLDLMDSTGQQLLAELRRLGALPARQPAAQQGPKHA